MKKNKLMYSIISSVLALNLMTGCIGETLTPPIEEGKVTHEYDFNIGTMDGTVAFLTFLLLIMNMTITLLLRIRRLSLMAWRCLDLN
ncbi:hypothetical protein H1D32_22395 [Anaerobacillus sp. CMMVII]|uniref:hypothetical protein n=1 Tax=Anaerobacillus sp. CMMVII TaxID=2755588 RepID=UPI0021B7029E|nr:hypothetical protein [Anaerobacillus sp. CMMVII]MCT8140205.1 hypothetical protein [Anaerobacillus sp. CMMVII]